MFFPSSTAWQDWHFRKVFLPFVTSPSPNAVDAHAINTSASVSSLIICPVLKHLENGLHIARSGDQHAFRRSLMMME
ncbi:MAG: hypothetical protein EBV97_18905 [Rhodobacteraceae bacterium]|nr:hypothetical protein [Paracoccaceae bacterium]